MNTIIRRLTDCTLRQEFKGRRKSGAPKSNGYYLVGQKGEQGSWGTCFLRVSKTRQEIDLTFNTDPSFFHTYTKIPIAIADNVFHVYVNYPKGTSICINAAPGDRVIGFDTPQPSGEYLNRSFLIYSPSGIELIIKPVPYGTLGEIFLLQTDPENEPVQFTCESMFKGRPIQKIFLNDDYYQKKHEFTNRNPQESTS